MASQTFQELFEYVLFEKQTNTQNKRKVSLVSRKLKVPQRIGPEDIQDGAGTA